MEKIKQFLESDGGKNILIVLIVILVGLGSFELGRLSKENSSSGIKIEYLSQDGSQGANVVSATEFEKTQTVQTQTSNSGKNFFASSRGSKYYPVNCSAGKTIVQENRVYFANREDAEKAGYELSNSCR